MQLVLDNTIGTTSTMGWGSGARQHCIIYKNTYTYCGVSFFDVPGPGSLSQGSSLLKYKDRNEGYMFRGVSGFGGCFAKVELPSLT